MGCNVIIHDPSATALDFTFCPLKLTVTVSPLAAHPHTFNGLSRCKTILLENIFGKVTLAKVCRERRIRSEVHSFLRTFFILQSIRVEQQFTELRERSAWLFAFFCIKLG